MSLTKILMSNVLTLGHKITYAITLLKNYFMLVIKKATNYSSEAGICKLSKPLGHNKVSSRPNDDHI